jgi:thiol-disulfide isomerase/thioredoxin
MKISAWVLVAMVALIIPSPSSWAQDATQTAPADSSSPQKPSQPSNLGSELSTATAHLKLKFSQGKTNATDLAENQSEIEQLIAQYSDSGSREQVARLYLLDAHIYADGLANAAKAREIWSQIIRDFPNTVAAKGASLSLDRAQAVADAQADSKVKEGLEIGQRFPGFTVSDVSGSLLAINAHHGKVLMIDFWATWCEPCREEMPNVIATYQQYHVQGFDIIGISLDEDQSTLKSFTSANQMPWQQYFDGLGWKNLLAAKYGIQSIPMDYLLDGNGIIIGKGLRGHHLGDAVAKAFAAK